jgi:hypothetical protein
MRGNDRLTHLGAREPGHAPLSVRGQRDLWLLHGENDGTLALKISDQRQESEHQEVNGTGALPGKRNRVVGWPGRDEEPHNLAKMVTGQITGEEGSRFLSRREINELAHAFTDFGPDGLQVLNVPNGWIEIPQVSQGL